MQNELFNLFNVFANTTFNAARQLTDMNVRTYERLVKRQIELTSDFVESAVKQSVSHYAAAQKEIAEEYADKVQKANKDTVKIIIQAQDELSSYLERQLPAAMQEVKATIKDTTQEAAEATRPAASKRAAA